MSFPLKNIEAWVNVHEIDDFSQKKPANKPEMPGCFPYLASNVQHTKPRTMPFIYHHIHASKRKTHSALLQLAEIHFFIHSF